MISFCASAHVNQTKETTSNALNLRTISIASDQGSSDQAGDEWPMFRGQLNHTGMAMTTPVQSAGQMWTYLTGGAVSPSPAVVGGRIYFGNDNGRLYCLNATTGAFLWSYLTGGQMVSSPAVAGNCVYVGGCDAKVYCLDALTGAFIWSYTTGNVVDSSPAIAGGCVYVGSLDHKVYCLNATTGGLIWSSTTGSSIQASSPVIADGRVYIGCDDHKIYCMDATTGTITWNYTTGGTVFSSPAISDRRLYVGSLDSKLYCLDAITGAQLWIYTTGGAVKSSPAVEGGCVYVGSSDRKLYCLNTITGTQMWNYTTASFVRSSPAVANGCVYFGGDDKMVHCLDATTGTCLWWYMTNGQIFSSPAIAGGRVYVGSFDYNVYCLPMILGIIMPSSPRDLKATNGIGQIMLNWNSPARDGGSAIVNYCIFQGTSPNAEKLIATIGNVLTFTSAGLTNGQIYYFKVAAVNVKGVGINSTEVIAMTEVTVPTAPQAFTATADAGKVISTWTAPVNDGGSAITGYCIYKGTTSNGEMLLTTVGNTLTYTATGLTNGQAYYFKIAAVNVMGAGANTTEASATPIGPPSAPQSLTTMGGDTQVILNWIAPVINGGSEITGYNLYQGTTLGGEKLLVNLGVVLTFTATGLTNGQIYYFQVAAMNSVGEGDHSNEANATPKTPITPPSAPQDLTITAQNTIVTLNWAVPASSGGSAITNYRVYQGTTSCGETLLVTIGNVLTYTSTGLTGGKIYFFQVSAVNIAGEGNRTNEVRVIHKPPVARFSVASRTIYINTPISFTDTSYGGDSPVVAWLWSFGDYSNVTMQNATHEYTEPGAYTITLTVRDWNGLESKATMTITVVAITSRQGLMDITAGLVIVLSAGIVTVVKLGKTSKKRE